MRLYLEIDPAVTFTKYGVFVINSRITRKFDVFLGGLAIL
jgi:hypothetical protein